MAIINNSTVDYLRYKLITRGWLMIPYILWVTFAAALNYSILFLN